MDNKYEEKEMNEDWIKVYDTTDVNEKEFKN